MQIEVLYSIWETIKDPTWEERKVIWYEHIEWRWLRYIVSWTERHYYYDFEITPSTEKKTIWFIQKE
jgi:fatty-acid desaturase